jgi:hypothetical protein
VFKVKLKSIGCIDRYKAPFITKGYSQMVGINYQETFSLVVKITSVRTLMAIVAKKNLELHYVGCKDCISKWISRGGYLYAKGLCETKYKTLGLQILKNLLWTKIIV